MAGTWDFDAMLFTRCPDCETTFRITAEALRKARGQVRCGRCACVFDAHSELREQREGQGADSADDGRTIAQGVEFDVGSPATDEPSVDADEADGDDLRDDGDDALEAEWLAAADSFVEDSALSDPAPSVRVSAAAAPSTSTRPKAAPESGPSLSATAPRAKAPPTSSTKAARPAGSDSAATPAAELRGTAPPTDTEVLDDYSVAVVLEQIESSRVAAENEADAESPGEQAAVLSFSSSETRSVPSSRRQLWRAGSSSAPDAVSSEPVETASVAQRDAALEWPTLADEAPRATRGWVYASLAAFLLLGVQLTNHFRSDLADLGAIGPLLRDVYARIGIDLIPRWDLGQYRIVDWVATAEPNAKGRGSLRITARIQNQGPRAQPFPYVHLQLKDRWEKSVASRMFRPEEYLASNEHADRLMPAGATARAELEVVDPGPDAYGFELDVCMEQPNHVVRCASDDVFR